MALAGYNVGVSIATGASATYTALDGDIQVSIGDSIELLDVTDFADSNLRRRIAGLRDIQIQLDGDLEDTGLGYTKLRASYTAGAAVFVQVILNNSITAASQCGACFAMLVESLERSASVDGKVELSASLQHEGSVDPITIGTGL